MKRCFLPLGRAGASSVFDESPAAGRAGSSRAAEAMGGSHNGHLFEGRKVEVPDVEWLPVGELHIELLVKVAIKDATLPIDADSVAAHEACDGRGIEVLDEELVVGSELLVPLQVGGVASNGHIRDAVKLVELDIEVFLEFALVVSLECFLLRGKEGAVGVVDKVELEARVFTVTKFVELLEGRDGTVKDIITALLVDIVRRITRHGGNADDTMLGVEFGNPFVARLFDNGGVEPGHDLAWLVEGLHSLDEGLKVRVHLGGSAGEVDSGNRGGLEPIESAVEVLASNELFAMRSGVNVTVYAGNVAKLTEVEL